MLQEIESGVLGMMGLGCKVRRNSPRKQALRKKSAFLLMSFLLFIFCILDILGPGYSLHVHLLAQCKAVMGLILQTMWDDVQDSTHNQQEDQCSGQYSGNIHFEKACHKSE